MRATPRPLVRVEVPIRAAYDRGIDLPWPVWRLTSPISHADVRIGADLALPTAELPIPVWILRTDDLDLLYPRDPATALPTVLVGVLLLPPTGAGYPTGGELA